MEDRNRALREHVKQLEAFLAKQNSTPGSKNSSSVIYSDGRFRQQITSPIHENSV
jgi:hypothetical protein